MVFTLAAVPLVVLVERLSLLKFAQAVCQLNVSAFRLPKSFISFKLNCSGQKREQTLVDILMPDNLQDHFFAALLVFSAIERVDRILLDLFKYLLKFDFLIRNRTSIAFSLTTVLTNAPSARDIFEDQVVRLLVNLEGFITAGLRAIYKIWESHVEGFFRTHLKEIFFGKDLVIRPVLGSERKINQVRSS